MSHTDHPDTASRTDPLTIAVTGFLALVAAAAGLGCLVYAVWWLVVFWAPT